MENRKRVVVEPYNPQWAIEFEALRTVISSKCGELLLQIEHVGSTAVPGLAAKPIIDFDLIVEDDDTIEATVIANLGFSENSEKGFV